MKHHCEMETPTLVMGFCDERGTIRIDGHWYCRHHADALQDAQQQWSGINFFPSTHKGNNKQSGERHDYGSLFDDEDEDQPSI